MSTKAFFKSVIIVLCVLSLLVFGSKPSMAKPKVIKEVSITTYGVGSQVFVFSAGISEGVQKVSGIQTRIIPSGTDVGRVLPLRAQEVEFSILAGSTVWFASHGTGDFAAPEWGPQPVRMGWRGQDLLIGYYTRGDSGVKKLSELKGKRVPQVPGSVTLSNLVKGALAFGGLTLDDCIVVNVSGLGAEGKSVNEGVTAVTNFGTTGTRPIECAAGPHGIHWFDLDPNDNEAWERLWKFCPWTDKALATRYAGKEKGIKPFHVLLYPYILVAYEKSPEDLVYTYAKAMWDSYDIYKSRHVELPYWSHENLANTKGCYYPYHNGVIKLMKEKGIWTAEHDKFQQRQLENEAKRMSLWKEAMKEAKAKKIKVGKDKWREFWWNKLIEAGLLK